MMPERAPESMPRAMAVFTAAITLSKLAWAATSPW